jgi:hypothetical protein
MFIDLWCVRQLLSMAAVVDSLRGRQVCAHPYVQDYNTLRIQHPLVSDTLL